MATNHEWLVRSRARSQQLLLDLHAFVAANRKELATARRDIEWSIVGLLIGSGFSLWRAAFLAFDADRKKVAAVIDDAQTFLTRLIEDNAINYPQDRATAEWSSGYYLNGARYRLNAVVEKLAQMGYSVDDAAFITLHKSHKMGIRGTNAAETWDRMFMATTAALRLLQSAWDRPPKKRRKSK